MKGEKRMVSARQMHPPRQISTRCIGLSSEAVNGAFDGQKKVIFLSAAGLRAPLVDTMKRARGRARGPLRTPVSLFVNLDFWGASKKRKGGEKPDWPLREIEGNSRRCFPLFLSSHLSTRARFLCLFLRPHKNQKNRQPGSRPEAAAAAAALLLFLLLLLPKAERCRPVLRRSLPAPRLVGRGRRV